MCGLGFIPLLFMQTGICVDHPEACDQALLAFGNFMGAPILLIIFIASIVVSVVLLHRQRRAFYVPLIGAAAMIGCYVVWASLQSNGFLIPYP